MFAGGIAVRKTDGKCGPTHARLPADPIVATPPPLPPSPFPMRGRRPPELQREAQRQASRARNARSGFCPGPRWEAPPPALAARRGTLCDPPGRRRLSLGQSVFVRPSAFTCLSTCGYYLPELSPRIPDQPSLPSTLPYRSCLCRTVAPCGRSSTHYRSAAPSPPLLSSFSKRTRWELGIGENTARSLAPYSNFGCHVIFAQSSATATSAARTHCTIQVQAHALSAVAQHSFSERIARGAVLDPKSPFSEHALNSELQRSFIGTYQRSRVFLNLKEILKTCVHVIFFSGVGLDSNPEE